MHCNNASNIFITIIPDDSSPISINQTDVCITCLGYIFLIQTDQIITSFTHHIDLLPIWNQRLISLYSDDHHYKSLVEVIQNKEDIAIATDGSKSRKVSGGNWVITDSKLIIIVEGHNPDFDNIKGMNSHCYKSTGVLSTIVFVHEYCKYFLLTFESEVQYYGDNLAVINKLLDIEQ